MQPAKAAQAFADQWRGRGYEKGETQTYWLALLRDVLGVARPEEIIKFEDQVRLGHTGFIDAYIEPTHVLIEQKSIDKDLRKPVRQSDGAMPYDLRQAHRTNDRAVLAAYGISPDTAEEDVTARLFALYKEKAKG